MYIDIFERLLFFLLILYIGIAKNDTKKFMYVCLSVTFKSSFVFVHGMTALRTFP